ncbi:MAG: radical SAM protein [Proteobacteria bacterium]|nr:radical SAM protein [Pseudomonadota bacterium]MBU1585246.1 radical SAM protein [Pseudomonadota bacterium]MBU2453842.1 radical SAM protein [Pseudomonadota bacterium]MBU2629136.1 radical SAM protein [Pseudomonadota bacterium]
MNDKFRIDSHKLMYHVKRVSDWLDNKLVFPIYIEISPSGTCNHRCLFCSVDFMGFKKRFLDTAVLKQRIAEMGDLKVKSIMFAGEGEPFLHKDLPDIIVHTKNSGIDVAITTNGVLMRPAVLKKILPSTEWIKISLNAGTPATYEKVHRTAKKDFNTVISNITSALEIREKQKVPCVIGAQMLLIPENAAEVETLTRTLRDVGVDYLVIKPYTHHYRNDHEYAVSYEEFESIGEIIKSYNTEGFKVIFRANAMQKWDSKKRSYNQCHALPFWSYIDATGNVWGCSAHLLEQEFSYGSIMDQTFESIWTGEKRKKSLEWVTKTLDLKTCKFNCRMDEVNCYLHELKNLPEHVNFI